MGSFISSVSFKKINGIYLALFIIILFGILLRTNHFLNSPPALFIDESDIGFQAYSLLKTGKDYYGNFLPTHPQSFADRRPFLYMFITIPSILIFGLNEWAVRFPSLMFGVLSIPALFWMMQNLLYRKPTQERVLLSLISAFTIAVIPWHIHYSRIGFELTTMLFFIILGIGFMAKWISTSKTVYLGLSLIFFILTMYIYSTAKLFVPMFLVIMAVNSRQTVYKLPKKQIAITLLLGTILIAPMAIDVLNGVGRERFSVLSIFTDTNGISGYLNNQFLSSFSPPVLPGGLLSASHISKIVFAQPVYIIYTVLNTELTSFSPQFLIFNGDPNPRQSIPDSGVAGLTITIAFLIGLYYLLKQEKSLFKTLIITLLIISPIPASITREGQYHATRLFFLLLPIVITAAIGFYYLIFKSKKKYRHFIFITLVILLGWEIARDQYIRLYIYPKTAFEALNIGWKQNIEKAKELSPQYDQVIIDNYDGAPIQTYYAFFTQEDPIIFQKYATNHEYYIPELHSTFNKFSNDNISMGTVDVNSLNEGLPIKVLAVIHYTKFDPKKYPGVNIVDIVNSPVNRPLYYLITNKYLTPNSKSQKQIE